MVKTRKQKTKPVDVRSLNDVAPFESLLKKGPITIVLIYADWCGHCQRYKEDIWKPLNAMPSRNVNLASVHFDQLENTSMKDAKIEGYPSVLVVGKDKVPATFKTEEGQVTNAMPNANNVEVMKTILRSSAEELLTPSAKMARSASALSNFKNSVASLKTPNTLTAPSFKDDVLPSLMPAETSLNTTRRMRGGSASAAQKQSGGSLLESLMAMSREFGHVSLLTTLAYMLPQKKKAATRKLKRGRRT